MIAAIVPAAGRSERMGRPKLLLNLGDETVIHRVVVALRHGGVGRVIVVTPPEDAPEGPAIAEEARRAGAEAVVPEGRPAEMRDSVELAVELLEKGPAPHLVLLTPGDSPGITTVLVSELLKFASRSPGRIIVPSHEGRRGHPIAMPWEVLAEVRTLPAGLGVNALVARHRDRRVEWTVSDPEVVADLDTPEDLLRWNRRSHREGDELDSRPTTLDQGPRPMDTIQVRVRLFALAKERAGRPEVEVDLPAAARVSDLRDALRARMPGLEALWSSALIAVDEEYAGDDTPIAPGSQVAVIPPVSGGGRVREHLPYDRTWIEEAGRR